jgi:hypothetical protein
MIQMGPHWLHETRHDCRDFASGDYVFSMCFERHLTLEVPHLRPLLFHLSPLPLVSALSLICLAYCFCAFIYLHCLLFLCFSFLCVAYCFCAFIYLASHLSLLFHLSARTILSLDFHLSSKPLSLLFHLF